MFFWRWMLVCSCLALVACATSKGGRAPSSEVLTSADLFGDDDDGRPRWLRRGSVALKHDDGRRVFYGVGLAQGIRNPALLRSSADNRARAELGRLMEVYTSSLMQDYQDSSGRQAVEQAVRGASQVSLQGAQVVDRYVDASGALYALAALDLAQVSAAVQEAEAQGAWAPGASQRSLGDVFDSHGDVAEAVEPSAVSTRQHAEEAELEAFMAEARERTGRRAEPAPGRGAEPADSAAAVDGREVDVVGQEPAWVLGEDRRFPARRYLCAVGIGDDRTQAEHAGYAALSRIFSAHVTSASKDFVGAYQKTGGPELDVRSAEMLTEISSARLFSNVQPREFWQAPDARLYGLLCLERLPAAMALREAMQALDTQVERLLEQSRHVPPRRRVAALRTALDALTERASLNAELRIVDGDGIGLAGPHAHVDVAAAYEVALERLKLGVRVDGPYAEALRGALIEGLAQRDYKVQVYDGGANARRGLDVLVDTQVEVQGSEAERRGRTIYLARIVAQVEIVDVQAAHVLGALTTSRKEGHGSRAEAERRAVRKLADKIVSRVAAKIDAAMAR